MVTRTREQWVELFEEFEQSKLLAREFCKERNICQRYFSKRKLQLGFGVTQKRVAKKLVKVERMVPADTTAQPIKLHYGDTTITLPSAQSPEWVASLLKALV